MAKKPDQSVDATCLSSWNMDLKMRVNNFSYIKGICIAQQPMEFALLKNKCIKMMENFIRE